MGGAAKHDFLFTSNKEMTMLSLGQQICFHGMEHFKHRWYVKLHFCRKIKSEGCISGGIRAFGRWRNEPVKWEEVGKRNVEDPMSKSVGSHSICSVFCDI